MLKSGLKWVLPELFPRNTFSALHVLLGNRIESFQTGDRTGDIACVQDNMNSVLFPTELHSWEILNLWYFPFCFSIRREVPPHPATHKIPKTNSTWHTSYQLQKAMWCEPFTSFKSRAASESIERRRTVFPQKNCLCQQKQLSKL